MPRNRSNHARLVIASLLLFCACADDDAERARVVPALDAETLEAGLADASTPDAAPSDAAPEASEPSDAAEQEADAEPSPDSGPRLWVSHYDYSFDLLSAHAAATLTLSAPAAGTGCSTLSSKLPLSELWVDSDTPFTVSQQDSVLTLCGEYQAGQQVTLHGQAEVPVRSDPTTGVGYTEKLDPNGSPFAYLLGWIEACDLFGPCDPDPSALANFSISVAHGPDDVVLCPGRREAGPRSTRCTLADTLAPTYSAFSIVANPAFREELLVSAAGVDVRVFEGAQGSLRSSLNAQVVAAFLVWLSELLGPFPYGNELRVASAPVSWLGMEHPANIVLRSDLASIGNLYQDVPLHTLLHEIAHQWAGNRVTLKSALDYAWKEAMAEYLVYRFEQLQRPASEATATLKVWHSTGNGAFYPVRPLTPPEVPLWVWTSGAYGSGPMTLFVMLEPYLGQELLLQSLQSFLREPGARSVLEWQRLLEQRSGLNLATYFNSWVYGRGEVEWPAFHVETQLLGSETQLKVTQTHGTRKRFPCVVELELRAASDLRLRTQVDFGLDPLSTTKTVRVPFDQPVTGVRIDPDGRLLDWSLSTGQKARTKGAAPVRFHP